MNSEQPNETEMRRILALKRHEQPPPAFFHGFSGKVIDGIHSAPPAPKLTLRQRLSIEFYGVPVYVCAAGVIVCGLLVIGLISSLRVETPPAVSSSGPSNPLGAGEPSHAIVPPPQKIQIGGDTSVPAGAAATQTGLNPARATLAAPPSGSAPK